ncbi:hypothetical protein [Oceaniglobus indicus]|uniref:hypothetical protein n=1 Tax=Oceaniglobus indicus TaxID=2047749 RepID=UPI000C18C2C5|nr:hypothetical protein [Oceaniglobus indicus]
MANPERRPVASLWIGEKLQYINQLCLLSHVQQGHPTTLYCTDTVENVPDGVIVRPATDIMDIDMGVVGATSASFLSNVFRYKMIQKTDAIWIDCDAFCHRPFPDDIDHIYAGHGFRGALNCGVVKIPRQGALIDALLDYYDNLPPAPPWFNKNQKKRLARQDESLPHAVKIYNAERTAFGPQAFTYFAQQTGDYDRAMAPEYLYPVPFQLNDIFFDPHGRVEGWFTDNTLSVHLYTNGTRPWWRKNVPLENSYVWRMARQVGVDPALALE